MSEQWKKWGVTETKKRAAQEFQKMVRYESADEFGIVTCVTCGKQNHYTNSDGGMHAGHFVSGRTNAVLFEEDNCHPQCVHCNNFLGGNQEKYAQFMLDIYGEQRVEEINQLRHVTVKWSAEELYQMREEFKQRWKVADAKLKGEYVENQLTRTEKSEYKRLKKQIKADLESGFGGLFKVRDQNLYREEYKTFAEFCSVEFGLTHRAINFKIKASETKSSLGKIFPKSEIPTKDSHLIEIAKAPEEKQVEVLERAREMAAIAEREPTANDFKVARKELEQECLGEDSHEESCQEGGTDSPSPDWMENKPVVDTHRQSINRIIKALKDAEEDPGFEELIAQRPRIIADLNNAKAAIVGSVPFQICPYCSGLANECSGCKDRGWVGKGQWDQAPEEMRDAVEGLSSGGVS